jgi:hypothetical protein
VGILFDLGKLPAGGKLSVLPLQILHAATACQATFSFLFIHAIVIQLAQDS